MNTAPRRGRPREAFRIIGYPNTVSIVPIKQPDTKWESKGKEVNALIRKVEEARDRAFPIQKLVETMEILEANRHLTVEEIEDLWEQDTNSWRNRQLFVCASIPEMFMRKHWHELSEAEHHNYFVHQKPSTQFLLDYWNVLTENERKACFEHQKLSMELLLRKWVQIGKTNPNNWLIVAQHQLLTPAFITLLWPEMDWWWKVKCISWQKEFPARLVIENWEEANHSLYTQHHQRRKSYYCKDLTMAELPEYLSCELEAVRTSAEEWLCELQRSE